MKTGTWYQDHENLHLVWTLSFPYPDTGAGEGEGTGIDEKARWLIRKSEFGFRRLVTSPGGNMREEAYLQEGPAETGCRSD